MYRFVAADLLISKGGNGGKRSSESAATAPATQARECITQLPIAGFASLSPVYCPLMFSCSVAGNAASRNAANAANVSATAANVPGILLSFMAFEGCVVYRCM